MDTTDTTTGHKRLSIPLALKFSAANEAGVFSGWASTFNGSADAYGDTIAPGAFTKTIADHRAAGTSPALLWAHDMTQPIGIITQLTETNAGLKVDGKLALDVTRGADAHALFKMNALGLSIGYRATSTTPMGKAGRRLDVISLFEVSAVAIPANSNARITSIKARPDLAELNDPRVLERCLRDAGYSRSQAREITFLGKAAFRPLDVAIADSILAKRLIAASAAFRASL